MSPTPISFATFDGTAVAGVDYEALSASDTISAFATSITITVDTNDDNEVEGDETFGLEVTGIPADVGIRSDSAIATIFDNDVNSAPDARDDAFDVGQNQQRVFDVIANDVDQNGDTLEVASVTQSSKGVVSLDDNGLIGFDTNSEFTSLAEGEVENVTFTYVAADGHGGTDQAEVTMSVTGVNDIPTATSDTFSVDEDDALVITSTRLMANDADIDTNDQLIVVGVSPTTLEANVTFDQGDVHYDASALAVVQNLGDGESLTDEFRYTISDGNGGTSTATVSIAIQGADELVISDIVQFRFEGDFYTSEGVPVGVEVTLDGDIDVLGATLKLSVEDGLMVENVVANEPFQLIDDDFTDGDITFVSFESVQLPYNVASFEAVGNSGGEFSVETDLTAGIFATQVITPFGQAAARVAESGFVIRVDGVGPTAILFGLNDIADPSTDPAPTNWQTQHSDIRRIEIQFDEDILADASDVRLTNLGVNSPVELDVDFDITARHVNVDGNNLVIEFAPAELSDGVYEIALSGVTDLVGNPMTTDFVVTGNSDNGLYKLTGDWSGDGGVSVFDFITFSHYFGNAAGPLGPAPEYVDLSNDGGISVFDFTGFSDNFGNSVTFGADQTPLRAKAFAESTEFHNDEGDSSFPMDDAVDPVLREWTNPSPTRERVAWGGRMEHESVQSNELWLEALDAIFANEF